MGSAAAWHSLPPLIESPRAKVTPSSSETRECEYLRDTNAHFSHHHSSPSCLRLSRACLGKGSSCFRTKIGIAKKGCRCENAHERMVACREAAVIGRDQQPPRRQLQPLRRARSIPRPGAILTPDRGGGRQRTRLVPGLAKVEARRDQHVLVVAAEDEHHLARCGVQRYRRGVANHDVLLRRTLACRNAIVFN